MDTCFTPRQDELAGLKKQNYYTHPDNLLQTAMGSSDCYTTAYSVSSFDIIISLAQDFSFIITGVFSNDVHDMV